MAANQNEQPRNKLLYVFSVQLLEALQGSDAIAVQDVAGKIVSTVPKEPDGEHWISKAETANRRAVSRVEVGQGDMRTLHEIPLRASNSSKPIGRLLVRFTSDDGARQAAEIDKAGAIIKCIARHLAISNDLSSMSPTSGHNKADIQFLTGLDKMVAGRDAQSAINALLQGVARHLVCTMAAVIAPEAKVRLFWPAEAAQEGRSRDAIIRAVGKLYANTRKSRKVIVSSDPDLLQHLETPRGRGEQILCSPIADPRSRVKGALIIVRHAQFSRDEVRVARAVCVKISGILEGQDSADIKALDRRSIIDRIDADIRRAAQVDRAFLFVDIDRLHIVNDRFGHAVGDETIKAVTDLLLEIAGSRDAVASLSGDLLGLYLDNADEEQAIASATKILDLVANKPVPDEYKSMDLSVSIGIALIPDHAATGSQAVSIAEVACQSAKSRGTGQYVLFRDHDASIMQRHADLNEVGNLQNALIEDRFVIYAQEIRSLQSDEPARKFELLTRMLDQDGNIVPPQKFLSAAGRYQMMPSLDRWVISQVLKQLSEAENLLEINLSGFGINVSGQSLADEGFGEFVVQHVLESRLSPDSLCFEITESAAVHSIEVALKFIDEVRKIGCSVALDDFGAGYCSFSYLQDIPVDFLKIDGMFVKNINDNPLSEAIVKAIVGIASVTGAATIAEYVEDDAIAGKVKELGVDFGQGYGIGRPEPLADVLDRMESPLDLGLTTTIRVPLAAVPVDTLARKLSS